MFFFVVVGYPLVLNGFFCGGALFSCVFFCWEEDFLVLTIYKTLEADPEAIWKHVLEQVRRDEMCILSHLKKAGRSPTLWCL